MTLSFAQASIESSSSSSDALPSVVSSPIDRRADFAPVVVQASPSTAPVAAVPFTQFCSSNPPLHRRPSCQSYEISELNNRAASLIDTERFEEAHAALSQALATCKSLQREQQQHAASTCSPSASTSYVACENGVCRRSCCRFVEVDYSYVNIFLSESRGRYRYLNAIHGCELFDEDQEQMTQFQAPLLLRTVSTSESGEEEEFSVNAPPATCCRIDEHGSLLSFVVVYNLALCFHLIGMRKMNQRRYRTAHAFLTDRRDGAMCLTKALCLYEIAHAFYQDQPAPDATSAESIMDCIMLMHNITRIHKTLGDVDRARLCQQHLLRLSFVWLNMFGDDEGEEEEEDDDIDQRAGYYGDGCDGANDRRDSDDVYEDDIEMHECATQDDIEFRTVRQVLRSLQYSILKDENPCTGHHVATAA